MMDATIARKTWRTLEPVHGCVYTIAEAQPRYEALGLHGTSGYFASRSAPMGAVDAEVVIATFFNFNPGHVRRAMADVWTQTTPAAVSAARLDAVGAAMRRGLGDMIGTPEYRRVAELLRVAATTAAEHPSGRPLFAGHAALPWPDEDEPHLVAWHAQSLLREFRGDGHVAALTTEGLSGLDALVLHHATGELPISALQHSRAWSDADWQAAVDDLATRGYVNADGTFTDHGRERRALIETQTDALSCVAYEALGTDACDELRALGRPISRAIVERGLLDFTMIRGANGRASRD